MHTGTTFGNGLGAAHRRREAPRNEEKQKGQRERGPGKPPGANFRSEETGEEREARHRDPQQPVSHRTGALGKRRQPTRGQCKKWPRLASGQRVTHEEVPARRSPNTQRTGTFSRNT